MHKGTKVIKTKRLVLRPFVLEDAKSMYSNWASDDEVTRYLMWPSHKNIDISKNLLTEWVKNYSQISYYQWAITLKDDTSDPIGCIGVNNEIDDTIKMVHIGYCIGRKWWHSGITSEALESIIQFLIEEVGLNRIESRHDPRNPNSGAVMKKCGMKYEAPDYTREGMDEFYKSIHDTDTEQIVNGLKFVPMHMAIS